jgi:hypothetical protein
MRVRTCVMHMCAHIYVPIITNAQTHAHMLKHTHTCSNTRTHAQTHAHMLKHTHTCSNTRTHAQTHAKNAYIPAQAFEQNIAKFPAARGAGPGASHSVGQRTRWR